MRLHVSRDRLFGERLSSGATVEGDALVGAKIHLWAFDHGQGDAGVRPGHWYLIIRGYDTTPFWADPETGRVPVYKLNFVDVDACPDGTHDAQGIPCEQALCRPALADAVEWQPISGMALLFQGDRYDAQKKTVSETGNGDSWFNVACAGSTVAKMHLIRHSWAASFDGVHITTVDQRQALLKMFVADYCGNGHSWTTNGHPLRFDYAQPAWPSRTVPEYALSASDALEAVWSMRGAECIAQPRMSDKDPDIADQIGRECRLSVCGVDWASLVPAYGYANSANPSP
jgi:hypothetical protein